MKSSSGDSPRAQRPYGLEALVAAVLEAQQAARALGALDGRNAEAEQLYARLREIEAELAAMWEQQRIEPDEQIDPIWSLIRRQLGDSDR